MANKPIHTVRYGLVKVTIWKNQTKSGERHAVWPVRLFKDGDTWRESARFGRDDLLPLAKALDQAHTWIYSESAARGECDES